MIVVGTVTAIEAEKKVIFHEDDGSQSEHRCVSIWVKSADETTQGSWVTIVKLYDNKIDEAAELGLEVNSMVNVDVRPTYRKNYKTGEFIPAITNKLNAIL
jgi:hypothetical protein